MNLKKIITTIVSLCIFMNIISINVMASTYIIEASTAEGSTWTNGECWSIAGYGDYAYGAFNGADPGLYIIENAGTAQMSRGTRINSDAITTDRKIVHVVGNYLFFSSGTALYQYNISVPNSPTLVASYSDYKNVWYMYSTVLGTKEYFFVGTDANGVVVFDMSLGDSAVPFEVGAAERIKAVSASDNYMYAVDNNNVLKVYQMTYGNTITGTLLTSQNVSSLTAVNTIEYLDGYICLGHNLSSTSARPEAGTVIFVDRDKLLEGQLVTYRYYPRGDRDSNISAGIYIRAMSKYKGLLIISEGNSGKNTYALDISDPSAPNIVWEESINASFHTSVYAGKVYIAGRSKVAVSDIVLKPFCKITTPMVSGTVTEFPFVVGGVADGASVVNLKFGDNEYTLSVDSNGKWSKEFGYYPNGNFTITASVGEYTSSKDIVIDVPPELTLTATLDDNTVTKLVLGDLSLDVNAENNTENTFNATLYAVLYNGDEVADIKSRPINNLGSSLDDDFMTDEMFTISENDLDDSILKIFAVSGDRLVSNVIEYTSDNYIAPEITTKKAQGDEIINIDSAMDHTNVSVEILATIPGYKGTEVLVTVYKPDGETIDYINVLKTDENESFIVDYPLSSTAVEEQNYTVKASFIDSSGTAKSGTDSFKYFGPIAQENAVTAVKGADVSNIIAKINDNYHIFGIDVTSSDSEYVALGDGSVYQLNLATALAADDTFTDSVTLRQIYEKYINVQKTLKEVNDAANVDTLKTIVENSSKALILSIDNTYIYNDLEDGQEDGQAYNREKDHRADVLENVISKKPASGYSSVDAFATSFEDECAIMLINVTDYTHMAGVLITANPTLQLDLSGDYDNLEDTDEQLLYVHKTLARTEFTDVPTIVSTFNSAVATATANKNQNVPSVPTPRPPVNVGGGVISTSPGTPVAAPVPIVEPTPEPENKVKFTDVNESHWAWDYIEELANEGVISGYEDGTLRVDVKVTRAEFIKLMISAYNLLDSNYVSSFNDVQKTDKYYDWYYSYVATAQALGLIDGDDYGNFRPNDYLSRQDMAVIVNKLYQQQGIEINGTKTQYADAWEISSYAEEAIDVLSELGIVNGVGNNEFDPRGNVTRAMAFKVICLSKNLGEE